MVSHSPLVTVIPLAVLEVRTQWEEEKADRCGLFFAAGLENMRTYIQMHVIFLDFPGLLSLDLHRASTQVHTPFL